mmetsp:Transcript_31627/g.77546  ORF Transcript_31627/g.77546 Transcript_31627/m.77546 type:complete len:621 (+) Transcript_31627:200-2062(+)
MPFVDTVRSFVATVRDDSNNTMDHQNSYGELKMCNASNSPDNVIEELSALHNNKVIKGGHVETKTVDAVATSPPKPKQHQASRTQSASAPKASLPVFQRADFQVGCMVGQGSFATVHKAKHLASGMSIALKVVRPESELDFGTGPNGSTPAVCYRDVLRAMKKEVNIMDSLGGHPHIVQVLGTAEDCRVFVMERAVSDLYTIVKQQETRLPLGHAKLWAEHMLAATAYIHSLGIVHQDIKSSNVLVFANRAAKLCDFGLAKKGSDIMVVDRELVTLWYRAPELLMGDDTYTPKVDEWGVGCVLLEMMIGVPPFKGKPECVCSCPQITHRNFNSDQLMKIFLTVGSPEKRSALACGNHFNRWPHFPRKLDSMLQRVITPERLGANGVPASAERVQEAYIEWNDLITSMLSLSHSTRPTASQVLDTPFFSGEPVPAPSSPPSRAQEAPMSPNTPTISRLVHPNSMDSLASEASTHPSSTRSSPPEAKANTRLSPEGHAARNVPAPARPTPGRKGSLDRSTAAAAANRKGSLPAHVADPKAMSMDTASSKPGTIMSTIRSKVEGFMRTGSLSRPGEGASRTGSGGPVRGGQRVEDARAKRRMDASPLPVSELVAPAENDDQAG